MATSSFTTTIETVNNLVLHNDIDALGVGLVGLSVPRNEDGNFTGGVVTVETNDALSTEEAASVQAVIDNHETKITTEAAALAQAKAAAAAQEAALATALAQSPQLLRFMSESTADAVTMASSLTDAEFKALVATVLHKLNDATQPALTAGMQAWLAAERAAGNTPTDAEYQAQYAALAENPL